MKTKLRMILLPLALSGAAMAAVLVSSGATAAAPCTGSACTAPVVKTTPATGVTSSSATLTGTVTPNGSSTFCHFNYGTTTAYGLQTATKAVTPVTATATQTSAPVTGLQSMTPFHYQLVCTNAAGSARGGDATFTTSDRGPSQIRLSGHTGFVSSTGMAGVFVGCYGDRTCTGSLKLVKGTTVIGQRSQYFIAADHGGIVHVPISGAALRQLKRAGHYQVTVESTTTEGQQLQGGDAGKTLTFHIFR